MERIMRKNKLLVLAVMLCLALTFAGSTSAQDGGQNRQLSVGSRVTGTLDATNFMQVYSLAATAGDTITINVTTDVEDLAPTVTVVSERGATIAQDLDITTATTASIADISIPENGTYLIIVARGSGATGEATGDFQLELSGVQQVGGELITLPNGGISISLAWTEAVNLNLEVRDPVGGTVHAFNPGTASGGTLDADANGNCDTATADNPTELVGWPLGQVPSGSYEIIVHYIDGCSIGGPQEFTVSATVNDGTTQTITGTVNPGQTYLARLILDPNADWRLQNGGVNAGLDMSIFQNQIANAQPIAIGSTISGTISNEQPAQAYSFDAIAGTIVNVQVVAQSGSLDTYLALLGPDNAPLTSNDDNETSTNSTIQWTLTVDGTYTVLVSRFALNIGGTEGDYALSLNSATTATGTPSPTTINGTPTGDTTALPTGFIQVQATWNTNADIQLQVRAPSGETVYDDNPNGVSGGILAAQGNVNCEATTTTPVSYIYWPAERRTPGTYEAEVWFQSTCEDNTRTNVALTVTVNGETIINAPVDDMQFTSHYLVTFHINDNGTASAGTGGFFDMAVASSLNYSNALDTATTMAYGQTVTGSITNQLPFKVYAFEGTQGDTISVAATMTGGNLDTAIYLISPEQVQLTYNDDVTPGEDTNSVISDYLLSTTGTYYVIVSHYGLQVGGTEGTFALDLALE
jgi:hypothetical protein